MIVVYNCYLSILAITLFVTYKDETISKELVIYSIDVLLSRYSNQYY